MKHILFTTLTAVAVLLSSCFKDNGGGEPDPTFPIQGLEMPASSAEHPILSGTTVNLKGIGFTTFDEIWLGSATKAANTIKAEGVVATSTGLSFTAPAINGESGITLKQAGKDYLLGKIYFSTGASSTSEHVYAIKQTDTESEFFEYDLDKGTTTSVFSRSILMRGVIGGENSKIYYGAYEPDGHDMFLSYYNLNEKKEVSLINKLSMDKTSIGMINNQLHILIYDNTDGYRLISVADNGSQTLVKTFGQLPDPTYIFFEDEDVRFVYDATSKSIIIAGESEYNDGNNIVTTILSFSLETGAIIAKHEQDITPNTSTLFNFIKTDTGILQFVIHYTWSTTTGDADTEVRKTTITYIDPTTLAKKSDIATIDCEFDRPIYVAGKKMLLGIEFNKYKPSVLRSFDLTTKSLKQVNSTENFGYLFAMSY